MLSKKVKNELKKFQRQFPVAKEMVKKYYAQKRFQREIKLQLKDQTTPPKASENASVSEDIQKEEK